MSKRHRKGRAPALAHKERFAGPLLIVGGLLILGVVLVIALVSNRPGETAGTTSTPEPVAGAPRVAVAQATIDLGTIRFNTPAQSVFTVRNVGDQALAVLGEPRVELVEGC